ncbi:MAG: flagellar hook-length control protein FliK, partial [Actinomycetota bacterium]|nr:flagellar hook-length control protein FliK [Actinomycetota bacterium]
HLGDQLGELTAQRAGSDHELTVQLDPADLGRVELRIHLADDLVHVHLGAQERSTADLVRQHLPELRAALESAGIATGGLDVGDHPGHRPPTSDDGPELAADLGRRPSPSLVTDPRSVATSSATALDLLL